MKQPELGQTILRLRKEKKLTQEELVERCNINVRTLQRIESGEVTPRDFTLKSLFSALDFDIDQIEKTLANKKDKRWIRLGWIFGIVYFILGLAEFIVDIARFDDDLPYFFPFTYTLVKMLCLISFAFFMMGFASLGRVYTQSVLRIGAFIMIGVMGIIEVYDIISLFPGITEEEFWAIKGIEAVMSGAVGLAFAYGIFHLHVHLGVIAKVAGILEFAMAAFFLSFIFAVVGLFILVPVTVIEIVLLYQAHDKLQTSLES